MRDPYICPGTSILVNKLNIRNQKDLDRAELIITAAALAEDMPLGNFDYSYLKSIHKHLFEKLYPWAGETRTVNIAKPSGMFCASGLIDKEITKLFDQLVKEDQLASIKEFPEFVEKFTYYFAEVNAIHPFREGNGRANRFFFRQLAIHNGYELNLSNISKNDYIQASISSHNCDNRLLEKLLSSALINTNPEIKNLYNKNDVLDNQL